MCIPDTIAIDGPAASGKSSLGSRLADDLEYLFFDSGVMYRAITWAALERGVPVEDEAAVTVLAKTVEIDVRPPSQEDGRSSDVLVDGQDVTWEVRSPEVDANVSQVSAYPGVRHALTGQQRRIGRRGRVVMVGRDIGTVVLPDASLKIYLDASVEERARRRYDEMKAHGEHPDYTELLKAMRRRDRIDSTRALAPLRAAEDAVHLNTDRLDVEQAYIRLKALVLENKDPKTACSCSLA